MKNWMIIIAFFVCSISYGQEPKVIDKDPVSNTYIKEKSVDSAIITFKEMEQYLQRINIVAMKQFNLTEQNKYNEILKELQAILSEAERKRKK